MRELHYPIYDNHPCKLSQQIFFGVTTRYIMQRGVKIKFKLFGEFKNELKKNLECESGFHMGLIHEKYTGRWQKYRATVLLIYLH